MKDILNEERENMSNKLKIFYIAIIIICIIAVIVAIVIQTRTDEEEAERPISQVGQEQISAYQEEFDSIFQNKVNYLENNSYKITKSREDEEIVYIGYQLKETEINDMTIGIEFINGLTAFGKTVIQKPENMQELEKIILQECGKEMRIKLIEKEKTEKNKPTNNIADLDIPINIIDE